MTKSNLDLARECGAKDVLAGIPTGIEGDVIPMLILFDGAQLDAFAERIRADAVAATHDITTKQGEQHGTE